MTNPYGDLANTYARAGWTGVVPLAGKAPVLSRLTGREGVDPDDELRAELVFHYAENNIGLRMPVGVVGVDIDHYGNKTGADTMARLIAQVGQPLPATWSSTSRGPGQSRILFFRAHAPAGRRWRNQPHIEIIHRGHRHAVVWPSVHPETGARYQWYTPEGQVAEVTFPRVIDLAEMPAAWIAALTVQDTPEIQGDVQSWLETARRGDACDMVVSRLNRARLALDTGESKHDTVRDTQLALLNLAAAGHRGVPEALAVLGNHFLVLAPGREREWSRALEGGIRTVMQDHDAPGQSCVCEGSSRFSEMINKIQERQEAQRATLSMFLDPPTVDAEGTVTSAPAPVVNPVAPSGELRGGPMATEFVTLDQLDAEPDPEPLVQDLLYRDSLAWLIAPSGSFKSFVALSLALSVAEGTPWMGKRVSGPSTVLYLSLEGKLGLKRRKRAWESYHQRKASPNVRVRTLPFQVVDDDLMGNLAHYAAETKPTFIIFDTQAKIASGYEENSNSDMSSFISRLDVLRQLTGACVLLVHHEGRGGTGTARGASAIDGAQDTELRIVRKGKSMDVTLKVDKQKDGDESVEVPLTMTPVAVGTDVYGESVSSLVPVIRIEDPKQTVEDELTEYKLAIMDIVSTVFTEGGATRAQIRALARQRGLGNDMRYGKAWDDLAYPKVDDVDFVPPLAKIDGSSNWVSRAHYEGTASLHNPATKQADKQADKRVRRAGSETDEPA